MVINKSNYNLYLFIKKPWCLKQGFNNKKKKKKSYVHVENSKLLFINRKLGFKHCYYYFFLYTKFLGLHLLKLNRLLCSEKPKFIPLICNCKKISLTFFGINAYFQRQVFSQINIAFIQIIFKKSTLKKTILSFLNQW